MGRCRDLQARGEKQRVPFQPAHFHHPGSSHGQEWRFPGERSGPGRGPELQAGREWSPTLGYLGVGRSPDKGRTCSQLPAAAGQLSSTCSSLATDQEPICMREGIDFLEPAGMQGAGDGQGAGPRGTGGHAPFKRLNWRTMKREQFLVSSAQWSMRGLGRTQMTDNLGNCTVEDCAQEQFCDRILGPWRAMEVTYGLA